MLAQASCRNASKPAAEIVVQDLPLVAPQLVLGRVAVVHVVRRIGEGHVGELAAEHPLDVGQHRRVAAEQPVLTEHPQIARLRDRLLRQRRRLVVLGQARLALARQQPLQLALAEADQPEVEAELGKVRQLEPQQRLVPAGVQRQLVVGQHIGALLRLAHVGELDHRHPLQAELPRRQHPAVPGDDAALRRRPAPGWSSRTPGCWRRSAPPGHRCGCADCGHRGSARPAAARRSPDRPSSGPHKMAMN